MGSRALFILGLVWMVLLVLAATALGDSTLVDFSLQPETVAAGGVSTATIHLAQAAPAGGVDVMVSLQPANGATAPATVHVDEGQTAAQFNVTDSNMVSETAVSVTLGPNTLTQTLHAVSSPGDHLVINEVDYDEPGTDTAEFVEIFNPTALAQSLTGKALVMVNGATNAESARVDLSPATCLAAGGYLVIRDPAVTVPTGALVLPFATSTNSLANGSGGPEGLALIETSTPAVLDALSYAGSITMATITGFPSAVNLVEGTATGALDSNTTEKSLIRSPNGTDSDDASGDWATSTTIGPGSANPGTAATSSGACAAANHAPVIAPIGDRTVTTGQTLAFTVSATDVDADPLTYSASNLPPGATFDPLTQGFSWTPDASQVGSHPSIRFTAGDGKALASQAITIVVEAPAAAGPGDGGPGSPVGTGSPAGSGSPSPGGSSAPPPSPSTVAAPTLKLGKLTVRRHTAKLTFKGSGGSGKLTYQCKLDRGKFKACRSPKSYARLRRGKHKIQVRAKDAGGRVSKAVARPFLVKR